MSRSHNAPLRFYPNEYPSEGEKVWVRVLEVNDTSATVQLLEYANHEGMIPYTEFTRLRIRSVGKIIKAGRMEAVQVLRVDTEKKYIDLSKKQVTPTEAKKCEEKFLKARDVHSIICHAADEVKMSRSEVMELVAYPLYRKHGCAWTCLKEALSGGDNALDELNMPKNLKDAILATASHRLREQPVRLRVDFEMTCFAADGVNGIREALRIGQQFGNDLQPAIALTASIVAPPAYALRTLTEHRDEGMRRMMEAVTAMQACVTAKGGNLRVTEAVRVIGDDITDKKDDKNAKGSSSSDEEDEEGEEAQ